MSESEGYVALFPGRPKEASRQIQFDSGMIQMTVMSAGKGRTLFGVGVVHLPPEAIASPEATQATTQRFGEALLASAHSRWLRQDHTLPALRPQVRAVGRGAVAVWARSDPSLKQTSGPTQLAAHVFIVGDRLFQITALGDETLTQTDLETFFGGFKLIR